MMRSMFAGVSGLRSHQVMMDVVGNNIANVNTTGFRASRVQFTDTLSQLLRGGSGGTGGITAGIDPQQVGLGVQIAKTQFDFGQGGSQLTGAATDLAIQGEGFFALRVDGEQLYTRAGSFTFDQQGLLTDPNGGIVQGWNADPTTGLINVNDPVGDIRVPVNQTIDPRPTSIVTLGGNLSANAVVGELAATSIDIVDNLGSLQRIGVEFENTAPNAWTMTVTDPAGATLGTTSITFDATTGQVTSPTTDPSFTYTPPGGSAVTFDISFGGGGSSAPLAQFGGSSDLQALDRDGALPGSLSGFAISNDGMLSGVFTNGSTEQLARLAMATFSNAGGLTAAGQSRFRATTATGLPLVGEAGTGGRGTMAAGQLEMSNVELAQEFTNLIVAQRGFQASSRIITTSDEMIQELVNLKR